ncbi:MAG: methyltransferase domain-containing protein [Sphingobacteriales bacterium]|nr:methyltransferase domain-containing protein [Sphingobacteriales bacterium]
MNNINDSFFDGYYKEIWKTIIPDELTVKEADFMIPYFNLQPGSHVLDLMCGYGRHAAALARKDIHVTAVDNLADYINEIRTLSEKENLPVKAIQSGVLEFATDEKFDLVICMGNSLNFFNAGDTGRLLKNINSFLKPGGSLLVNSWSIAEIVIKNFKEKSWSQVGDMKFLTESKFLFHPTRVETDSKMIAPDGKSETKKGIDYIFSINEMEEMMSEAGLILKEVYSIPGRRKFTIGEPRAYLVAEKK